MIVEQAIFTSARSGRGTGYHLVAVSPGICEADSRELSLTGASHDSLWEQSLEAISVNFHALPSGALCVSQTTPEGAEYSGRGGARIYTHALVVKSDDLRQRFANNPLALLRAALAQGAMQVFADPPEVLEPIELLGRGAAIDTPLLASWAAPHDRARLAAMLDAAITAPRLGLAVGPHALRVMATVVNALPVDCRGQVAFSTGLRFSPSRPFRICCLDANQNENRRLERLHQLPIIDFNQPANEGPSQPGSWGHFVATMLAQGDLEPLAEILAASRPGLRLEQLHQLAHSLVTGSPFPESGSSSAATRQPTLPDRLDAATTQAGFHRADGGHDAAKTGALATAVLPRVAATMQDPSCSLARRFPDAADNLLRLEGVVFEALAGRLAAAAGMSALWRELLQLVGRKHIAEVRELYLRYAITLWRELNVSDPQASHERGIGALEILGVLAEGGA